MDYVQIVGYIASFLVMIAFVPQAITTLKTKDVEGISLLTFSIVVLASIVWTVYGFLKGDLPIILTNVVLFVVQGLILITKIRYMKK